MGKTGKKTEQDTADRSAKREKQKKTGALAGLCKGVTEAVGLTVFTGACAGAGVLIGANFGFVIAGLFGGNHDEDLPD